MRFSRAVPLLLLVLLTGCVHRVYESTHSRISVSDAPVSVDAPVRVHLSDGGVVLFRSGARVGPDAVEGRGIQYDLTRRDSVAVDRVSMDSVVGIEAYEQELQAGTSVLLSMGATAGMTVLVAGGLVAIACAADPKCFGSCPTVYTDGPGGEVLEAELFSYSIAPLLEGRDVDVLGVAPEQGRVRLEIRNEAMETHSINHLQLLEVRHRAAETVGPDERGLPIAWTDARPPLAATGGGQDVTESLREADGVVYAMPEARLGAVTLDDLDEHVVLEFPRPAGDSAALVLRLRNSLLNTVLFYDMMLGAAGARALTWMASDLQSIGEAVRLGRWWSQRMGLHVEVEDGGAWREVARLPDTGPIAWTRVAVTVPLPPRRLPDAPADGDPLVRLRLRFPADGWRIDRAELATFRRPQPRRIDPARVVDAAGRPRTDALEAAGAPDERYVRTVAGDAFTVEFDVGEAPETGTRTFLLSSQGYYTEWVRPAWIRAAGQGEAFLPSDASLLEAMRRWHGAREEFEHRFFETRIPTRSP